MTSSMMDENSNMLDYNFLANLDQDEPDILDEFLDQRVYDSLGPGGTPVPVKQEQPEYVDNLFEGAQYAAQYRADRGAAPNTEYLYVDPSQYQDSASSTGVYPSPFDKNSGLRPPPTASKNSSVDGDHPADEHDPKYQGFHPSQLSDHELIRDELTKLKFGNHFMNPCPDTLDVPDPSYLDFSPAAMASLPYKLELFNLPKYSRVETQIKLKFTLSPLPANALLYIPQDLISKNKFCLNQPLDSLSPRLKENLLHLDAYVLTSDLKKSCNICSRCIKREQKRASRIKAGLNESDRHDVPSTNSNAPSSNTASVIKNNPNSWADDSMVKKAIIFNCKEIMSFPPPSGLSNDLSKSLELSARIICYCRHHKESNGFKLLFVIKNNNNEVVAKHLSTPITIMDRKKNTSTNKNDESIPNSIAGSSTNLKAMNNDTKMENDDDIEDKPTVANSIVSNNSDNEFNSIQHSKTSSVSTPNIKNDSDTQMQSQAEDLLGVIGHPLSPNSIDESASEPHTQSEGRGLKRKKLSVDDSFNSSSNPMFNGSVNGFSPMSNSDTNTSTTNNFSMMKPGVKQSSLNQFGLLNQSGSSSSPTVPSIQRIIPAQGPIRGGIEVTLLGFNFRPGLSVKFGANQALATHCWSETTIVTYLPPATQPGQVLVSFENHEDLMLGSTQQSQIFTYTDDTDRQLIELALQIVGLKMNGKLEDAKNIARRIVGTDSTGGAGGAAQTSAVGNASTYEGNSMNKANIEWFDNAHKAVEELTKSDLSTEEILINFLSLVDLPNCPIIIPNWQLCNKQGQSLLHLSTLKRYSRLVKFLITHGCKIDIQDNQGLTPLFLASMCGHRDLIEIFIDCKSNWNLKLSNDKYLKDYCDLNVLDIFSNIQEDEFETEDFGNIVEKATKKDKLNKSISSDSLNSMLTMSYGRHISKMVMDQSVKPSQNTGISRYDRNVQLSSTSYDESNCSSEFADSEFESNDDEFEETDDYDEEYDDDYDSESIHSEVSTAIMRNGSPLPSGSTPEDADESSSTLRQQGLWQKVKNVFNQDDSDALPSYDDLFPFGPSSFQPKPKSEAERSLNESVSAGPTESSSKQLRLSTDEDTGNTSDSSEDLVVSFINHPRKTVENDKMLLFFWFPVLICIIGCFFLVSIMGYQIEMIEHIKVWVRDTIGNIMVGSERIARVFKNKDNARSVLQASYDLMVE